MRKSTISSISPWIPPDQDHEALRFPESIAPTRLLGRRLAPLEGRIQLRPERTTKPPRMHALFGTPCRIERNLSALPWVLDGNGDGSEATSFADQRKTPPQYRLAGHKIYCHGKRIPFLDL